MDARVPMTRDEAIAALVELDVTKWGDGEREASEWMHRGNLPTYGLALNALAQRLLLATDEDRPTPYALLVRDAARAAMTDADRAALRD